MQIKSLIIFLCSVGLASVSYGMLKENDFVFILGILFVIIGYIMIRKRISRSIREKE